MDRGRSLVSLNQMNTVESTDSLDFPDASLNLVAPFSTRVSPLNSTEGKVLKSQATPNAVLKRRQEHKDNMKVLAIFLAWLLAEPVVEATMKLFGV